MKKINLSLYRKEIISILAGMIILVFPDILSKSVNYAGFIIIIISLVMMLADILFRKKSSGIFGDCMGIFIGIFVIFLSDFIKNGIPMLIGIAAIVIGIKISANIISGAKSGRKVGFNIIPGILLTAAGILSSFSIRIS